MNWSLILTIAALILFLLASFPVGSGRVQLGWLGLACLTLAWLLNGATFGG